MSVLFFVAISRNDMVPTKWITSFKKFLIARQVKEEAGILYNSSLLD